MSNLTAKNALEQDTETKLRNIFLVSLEKEMTRKVKIFLQVRNYKTYSEKEIKEQVELHLEEMAEEMVAKYWKDSLDNMEE